MNCRTLTAASLMNRNVQCAKPGESLLAAARRMNQHGVRCLLVPADEPGRTPGVITAKDIVQLLGDANTTVLDELFVRDAMTSPAITIQKDMRLADAINFMRMTGVRRVPVMDGESTVGMLSFTDVLRAIPSA